MAIFSRPIRWREVAETATERLLDLLFPRVSCPLCGGPAGEGRDAGICATCLAALLLHPAARVADRVPASGGGLACGMHEDILASAIRRFKYGPDETLGEPLGRLLAARVAMAAAAGLVVEAVVPVPLHRARLLRRGFNQAEVLATYVGRRLGVPVQARWLRRVRRTETQAGLGRGGRLRNMQGAFRADRRAAGTRVLLIDDVITTGATLQACSEALSEAAWVGFAAVASAPD